MSFLQNTPVFFVLALYRRRFHEEPPPDHNLWVLEVLSLLVFFLGLSLLLMAISLAKSLDLGAPPPHLSGERDMNDGQMMALAGVIFLIFAWVSQINMIDKKGIIFLMTAALVLAGWGGARMLLACGGIGKATKRLSMFAVLVMLVALSAGLWLYIRMP